MGNVVLFFSGHFYWIIFLVLSIVITAHVVKIAQFKALAGSVADPRTVLSEDQCYKVLGMYENNNLSTPRIVLLRHCQNAREYVLDAALLKIANEGKVTTWTVYRPQFVRVDREVQYVILRPDKPLDSFLADTL